VERVVEALGPALTAAQLYGLLRLRAEVFVVEQACAYLDPDGLDLQPTTRHLWVESDGAVVSALRVVGQDLGRVVTAPSHRSRGLAAELVKRALDVTPRPVRLNAQSYLVEWYGRFGFVVDGAEFVEDGIPHTPMALA
jgi:ElaA protein